MMFHTLILLCSIFNCNWCINKCPQSVQDEKQLVSLSVECFKKLYDYKINDGHKVSQLINDRLINLRQQLQSLKMGNIEHDKTTPVIKWAQSQSQIYLSFKLSHRQDSPPCSDVTYQKFQFSNIQFIETQYTINYHSKNDLIKSFMTFQGQCFFLHQKLLFTLDLQFKQKLTKLIVKKGGLGSYILIGYKQTSAIWIKPFKQYNKASIWSQMRLKFEQDMNKYFEMIENINNNNNQKRRKKKYKNKQKVIQMQKNIKRPIQSQKFNDL